MNTVDEKTTAIIGQWCNGSTSAYLRIKGLRSSKKKLKNQASEPPTTVDELVEVLKLRKKCKPKIYCIIKCEKDKVQLHGVVTCCMTKDTVSGTMTKPLFVVVSNKDCQRIKQVFALVKPSNKLFISNKIYYQERVQMTHIFYFIIFISCWSSYVD
jgi:hypothetical protein